MYILKAFNFVSEQQKRQTMKRILFFIMFFTVAISTRAQVTLDECRHAAQENYPLVRQYNLIQLAEQYNLSNASKGNLPQINISGKASYQSDATTFPIDIPGIGIKGLPKNQYQALIEVQQNIWDGGQIHHQKKEIEAVSQENKYQLDVSMYALNEQVNQVFFGILLLNEQLHQNALLHDNLQRNLKNIEAYRNNGIANDADVDAVKVEILNTKQQRIQLSENPCSWTAHIVHHPHAGSCPASLGNGTDDTYYHFIRNHFPDRKYASYTAMDLLCHSCPLVCITGKTTDDRRSTAILCMERSMCTPVYGCDTNRYYL